ncbi:MAG: hypothetical protein ABW292_03880 [Vicinamibacterales bacterium]
MIPRAVPPRDRTAHSERSRRFSFALWILFALFTLRVIAQPLALVVESAALPRFESWHSAALPYGVLLSSQILILVALGWTAWRFTTGNVAPRQAKGKLALALGTVYSLAMVLRLVLGATVLSHVRWFASPLPTVFHLVLAGYLLVYGRFHYLHGASNR